MTGFIVDISGLEALKRDLGLTSESIDQALTRLKETSSENLGSEDIDEACRDFTFMWRGGLELLGEAAVETQERLKQAISLYNEIDLTIARLLQKIPS